MIGERLSLQALTTQYSGFVKCGVHSSMVAIQGKGTISLQIESGNILRVPWVLYVPSMRVSVLSILDLEHQGYGVRFFGSVVHIRSIRNQTLVPPMMIGISEISLYKPWGKNIYNFKDRNEQTIASCLKE
jgi:hypothetical protein